MENQEWNASPKEQYYNGSKNTFEINTGNDGECVAEVVHGFENALLMAAAPELLKSLKDLLDELSGQSLESSTNFYLTNAKEAIRKAEGK